MLFFVIAMQSGRVARARHRRAAVLLKAESSVGRKTKLPGLKLGALVIHPSAAQG